MLSATFQVFRNGEYSRGVIMIEMSPAQVRHWRGRASSSTVTLLMVLDGAPDWERVWSAHEWAVSIAPRLSDRVVDGRLWATTPMWTAARSFQLSDHLSRTTLDGKLPDLLLLAQSIASIPLDRSKPLWEATFVEECNAYILKVHRSLAESLGGIALLERLLNGRPAEKQLDVPARRDHYDPSILDDLIGTTMRLPGDVTSFLRSSLRTSLETSVRVASRPRETAGDGLRFVGSMIGLSTVHRSALWTMRRGTHPKFGVVCCSSVGLSRAAEAAGGSIEDAYLAGVLGGINRYHEKYWAAMETMPVLIEGVVYDLPVGEPDPAQRISALSQGARGSRGAADLASTIVPGVTAPAYLAGARVKEMFAFAPLDSAALTTTLTIHGNQACVAVNCDGDSVSQPALLIECMQDGFDEVLALGFTRRSRK